MSRTPVLTCARCGRKGERGFWLGEVAGEYANRCQNVEACTKRLDRPVVEDDQYTAFMLRVTRAMARRAASNVDALAGFSQLQDALDEGRADAIDACRADGLSWDEIGRRMGMSKQAVQQWHARRRARSSHAA